MVNVEIDLGRHTMRTPHGMKKLFEETIKTDLEISQGNFKVHLGKQIRGGTEKGIKFIKLLPEGSGMIVKAQPAGKDGRHICTLKFPDMYKSQLSEFAEKLREKCGQEEISAEEETEELQEVAENPEDAAPAEADQGVTPELSKQQYYLPESEVLSSDMVTLILSEIHEKRGFEWVDKRMLFRIIKSLKLSFPENVLIGRLLKMGYLEKNPDNPLSSSRLSFSAKFLLEEARIDKMTQGMELVSYDEEELKILNSFKELRRLADEHAVLQESLAHDTRQLDSLTVKKEQFRERIERFNNLARIKMEEMETQITQTEEKIKQTKEKITPRMVGATRKYEILVSDLPSE